MAVPVVLVTRRFCRRCMSVRASSSICTRIGTRRSPALNLARLASMSPMVATRIVSAILLGATPRRAASSNFGTTRSSGRSIEASAATLMKPGTWRSAPSSLRTASFSSSPLCDSIENDSSRSPRSLTYQARMSGTSASLSAMMRLDRLLRQRALGLGDELHEQRGLAHLERRRSACAAEHEDALHLRDGLEDLATSDRW